MSKHEKRDGKSTRQTTPSTFGSHASMVVRTLEDGRVVCKDEVGEYVTRQDKLDTGLADVNRYSGREQPPAVPIVETGILAETLHAGA